MIDIYQGGYYVLYVSGGCYDRYLSMNFYARYLLADYGKPFYQGTILIDCYQGTNMIALQYYEYSMRKRYRSLLLLSLCLYLQIIRLIRTPARAIILYYVKATNRATYIKRDR